MEYAGEPWVQRLRDGQFQPLTGVVVAVVVLVVVGGTIGVLMLPHDVALLSRSEGHRGSFGAVVLPWFAVAIGVLLAAGSVLYRRRDRAALERMRAAGVEPAFLLPTVARYRGDLGAFPALTTTERPRPQLWSVDERGLRAWSRVEEDAVVDLPWSEVLEVTQAERRPWWAWGQSIWDLAIDTTRGRIVLLCRGALGGANSGNATKVHVFSRVLSSLRRDLDPERPRGSALP